MKIFYSFLTLFLSFSVHAAVFTEATSESFTQASYQMSALNKAMKDGADLLKNGDLAAISAHSQYISSLVKKGESQFGSTVFEPLGSCFAAGLFSRSWWNAQLAATHNGGIEKRPGSIADALSEYTTNRDECLKTADPQAAAQAKTENDAQLQEKLGGGRECLTVFDVDPESKAVFAKPKPAHCKS